MIDPEIPGKLFQNFVYFGPRNSKKAFDFFGKAIILVIQNILGPHQMNLIIGRYYPLKMFWMA